MMKRMEMVCQSLTQARNAMMAVVSDGNAEEEEDREKIELTTRPISPITFE